MTEARFSAGDRVRVLTLTPRGHVRTPGYARGHAGRVERLVGAFRNPESLAHGGDGLPERPLYRVRFRQGELWQRYTGSDRDTCDLDLFEHWLELA